MRRFIVTVGGLAMAGLFGACAPAYVEPRPAYARPAYGPVYGEHHEERHERHEAREHEEREHEHEHEHEHGDDHRAPEDHD